jgi:hypothetical protein
MNMQKGNRIAGLDTGNMVRSKMWGQRMTHAMLARKMQRGQSTVKGIIHNTSMQCYLLWEFSVALNHNFFSDLAAQLNAVTEGKLEQQQTELEQLKQEYQHLKEERDYLRKAVDLISK